MKVCEPLHCVCWLRRGKHHHCGLCSHYQLHLWYAVLTAVNARSRRDMSPEVALKTKGGFLPREASPGNDLQPFTIWECYSISGSVSISNS